MPLAITTQLITQAAERRGWRVTVKNEKTNFIIITTHDDVLYVRSNTSHKGGMISRYISNDKQISSDIVATIPGVFQPATEEFTDYVRAEDFLATYGRVVIKPLDLSHGNGITTNIQTPGDLHEAIEKALSLSKTVLLQQHIVGDDYRILIIDDKLAAAAIRDPASVIGNGEHTIAELMDIENQQPDRGPGYTKSKTYIDIAIAKEFLGEALQDIPPAGQKVQVVGVANIGRGGVAIDVTDTIDPAVVDQALRITKHLKLGMAGVDFMVDASGKAYFIELNAKPSFGLHAYPVQGKPRNVADQFLDWLTT